MNNEQWTHSDTYFTLAILDSGNSKLEIHFSFYCCPFKSIWDSIAEKSAFGGQLKSKIVRWDSRHFTFEFCASFCIMIRLRWDSNLIFSSICECEACFHFIHVVRNINQFPTDCMIYRLLSFFLCSVLITIYVHRQIESHLLHLTTSVEDCESIFQILSQWWTIFFSFFWMPSAVLRCILNPPNAI